MHEFNEWKSEVEENILCVYVLSARRTNCQNKKIMYLDCCQTSIFGSTLDIRNVKCQTKNIGSTCSSSMKVVTEKNGTIVVDFCITHFGHDVNLDRYYFTPEQDLQYLQNFYKL
ncbi:uncharacterized protein LOC112685028 [Sipha flava]|nr:uncharacterized protein LOC112685028 [Sipha flava]